MRHLSIMLLGGALVSLSACQGTKQAVAVAAAEPQKSETMPAEPAAEADVSGIPDYILLERLLAKQAQRRSLSVAARKRAGGLLVRADNAYERKDYEAAAMMYLEIISKYGDGYAPAAGHSHVRLGRCFMALEQYERAALCFQMTAAGYPQSSRKYHVYTALGDTYMALEQYRYAWGAYYWALVRNAENVEKDVIHARMAKARQALVQANAIERKPVMGQ